MKELRRFIRLKGKAVGSIDVSRAERDALVNSGDYVVFDEGTDKEGYWFCNVMRKSASRYKMERWAVKEVVRDSGIVEHVCKHGVGHPVPASAKETALKYRAWEREDTFYGRMPKKKDCIRAWNVHGCDGCCQKKKRVRA